jgi:small nuclear ribonucleoprotein (snRNP)-like protein
MNKINNANILSEFAGRKVIVKLVNGRAISGLLNATAEGFNIKLGVKYIALDAATVAKVTAF